MVKARIGPHWPANLVMAVIVRALLFPFLFLFTTTMGKPSFKTQQLLKANKIFAASADPGWLTKHLPADAQIVWAADGSCLLYQVMARRADLAQRSFMTNFVDEEARDRW